jgi:hypothetical protein
VKSEGGGKTKKEIDMPQSPRIGIFLKSKILNKSEIEHPKSEIINTLPSA